MFGGGFAFKNWMLKHGMPHVLSGLVVDQVVFKCGWRGSVLAAGAAEGGEGCASAPDDVHGWIPTDGRAPTGWAASAWARWPSSI